ncbi:MAG: hypothetical protein ACREDY_26545 [Bradyrhizobium sp.]
MLAEQRGGAEIEIAILYADVRGSTGLAARVGPTAFADLMQRFFRVAVKIFTRIDAIVDKMVGDEMICLFVPGLTGASAVSGDIAAEPCNLELKGYVELQRGYVARLHRD